MTERKCQIFASLIRVNNDEDERVYLGENAKQFTATLSARQIYFFTTREKATQSRRIFGKMPAREVIQLPANDIFMIKLEKKHEYDEIYSLESR